MQGVKPEAVSLMLIYNGLDGYTRGEIATEVNNVLGTDYTGTDASDVINAVEDEAKASDTPHLVFMQYVLRGAGASIFSEMAPMVSFK